MNDFMYEYINLLTLEQKLTYIAVFMWIKGIIVGMLLEHWFKILNKISRWHLNETEKKM
jgi:hypothetical protein